MGQLDDIQTALKPLEKSEKKINDIRNDLEL